MSGRPFHVLVLCTGNSARSILAECSLERRGKGRIRSFSAGSHPKPQPHPRALALLRGQGFDTSALRSKSWDEFAGAGAPPIDLVLTVCGNADRETCPVFPGAPLRAHWGVDDPAACTGSETGQQEAFERAWRELDHKVAMLCELPFQEMGADALAKELRAIADAWPA